MTKPAVSLETSMIGYATSRPSRDLVIAARQQITREWFALRAPAGELVARLVGSGAVPRTAAEDALHIAVAAVHGVDYLPAP